MNSAIASRTLGIAVVLGAGVAAGYFLAATTQEAFAVTASRISSQQPSAEDVVFYPVGNQDVRKFVFYDRRTNQIYIYGGGGKYEQTWQVGALGQNMVVKK